MAETPERLTFTFDDVYALVAGLSRLGDNFALSLGQYDRTNMMSLFDRAADTDLCGMRDWFKDVSDLLGSHRAPQSLRSDNGRKFMVNLLGVLYIVMVAGHQKGFTKQHCDWASEYYSSILEVLNIELV